MSQLYIVSTPIGNLEDITLRAIRTLFSVDYIACEDTRKTGQLIKRIANYESRITDKPVTKKPKFVSFYEGIEEKQIPTIISLLEKGKNVSLVSNAGTPLIADPGFKLVRECIKRKIRVIPIPGPSALLSALVSSGLPVNNFWFLGYLPKKRSRRRHLLKSLNRISHPGLDSKTHLFIPTFTVYEVPHRLRKTLTDMKEVLGDIEIVVARELTKIYEEIWRGKISKAQKYFTKPRGEIVILFR